MSALSATRVTQSLIQLEDEMRVLCQEVRQVEPLYVYMELYRRKERGKMSLRWRTPGRQGSSITFESMMVYMLNALPKGLKKVYTDWEVRRLELNEKSTVVCAHARNLLSQKTLKQLSLVA